MQNWGSEFNDDGGYGKVTELPPIEPTPLYLPMEFMDRIVDNRYLREISVRDKRRLENLAQNISINGILVPAKLIYDSRGLRLQDGNHRFLAARMLGLADFPVELVQAPQIKAPGLAFDKVLVELLYLSFDR